MDQIANGVSKATRYLNYRYLTVDYVSDLCYKPSYWYRVRYSLLNGSPELVMRDSI